MKRLLAAASIATAAAVFAPAPAEAICSLHYCIAAVCGSETHCGPVRRCYYFTDYPTCIYP